MTRQQLKDYPLCIEKYHCLRNEIEEASALKIYIIEHAYGCEDEFSSPVEEAVETRESIDKAIERYKVILRRVVKELRDVNEWLRGLEDTDSSIIKELYIRCTPWDRVCTNNGLTEKELQLRLRRIFKD
jgi:hypothetical protein